MKSQTNNVVLFPPNRVVNPLKSALQSAEVPADLSQIKDAVYIVKVNHINKIIEIISPLLAQAFLIHEINIFSIKPDTAKHLAFMMESIKAFLFKLFDLEHPFHRLVDQVFSEGAGGLKINNIVIKENGSNTA